MAARAAQKRKQRLRNAAGFYVIFTFLGAVFLYTLSAVNQEDFADIDKDGNIRVKVDED